MLIIVLIICGVDCILGGITFFYPNGVFIGIPIILSSIITAWLAVGVDLAYKNDIEKELLKKELDRNKRTIQKIAEKIGVSYEELEQEVKEDIKREQVAGETSNLDNSNTVDKENNKDSKTPTVVKCTKCGELFSSIYLYCPKCGTKKSDNKDN